MGGGNINQVGVLSFAAGDGGIGLHSDSLAFHLGASAAAPAFAATSGEDDIVDLSSTGADSDKDAMEVWSTMRNPFLAVEEMFQEVLDSDSRR
jgi:hypothetical protein